MAPPEKQPKQPKLGPGAHLLAGVAGDDEPNRCRTQVEHRIFSLSIRRLFLTTISLFALAGTTLYYAVFLPDAFLGRKSELAALSSDFFQAPNRNLYGAGPLRSSNAAIVKARGGLDNYLSQRAAEVSSDLCKAPNPNLFAYDPLQSSNEAIIKAGKSLDSYLSQLAAQPDVDSISVAVVSAAGTLFEGGYGTLRANETDPESQRPVDRDSIYRIGSVTKMFTVLETLILREKGVLNWDDPVTKYVPDFKPPTYGWADFLDGSANANQNQGEPERITLRQLASHLAGIGRDYPPNDIGEWPTTTPSQAGAPVERTYEAIMKALTEFPLVNVPYEYPLYSNIGLDLLGLANVVANKQASSDPQAEPQTHRDLVKRDIFDRIGMNSSSYRLPEAPLRDHMAVPSANSIWADLPLGDMDDATGGQYSSLKDLTAAMKTFLSPSALGGVVPARVVREWLRPLYVWGSSEQQVGAPWEIFLLDGGAKAYTKSGNLPGYNAMFSLVPEYSYGIIILVTGAYGDTFTMLNEASKVFHTAIAEQYQVEIQNRYAGTWTNGTDVAEVTFDQGTNILYLSKLVIKDIDVLKLVQQQDPTPVALWSTGRIGEFRLAFGRPELNNIPNIGCMPYWFTIGPGSNSRGAPIDLLFWNKGVLTYPSSGVSLARNN